MGPLKFKAPKFPHFFLFFFALVAVLQQALTIFYRIGGLVVEFAPATRKTGVWFPPKYLRSSVAKVCCANYFIKFDVTFLAPQSLKGRENPGLNRKPFDLQSKALPLSYIPVQVAPWLLQNAKHPPFPIFFSFFRVSGCSPTGIDHVLSYWWFSGRIRACHSEDRGLIPAKLFTI